MSVRADALPAAAVAAHKVALGHPRDASGLERLVREGRLDPDSVVAVVGKTQGSGDRHDPTRMDADHALRQALLDLGTRPAEEIRRIPMVFSSGAVGLLEPNAVLFTRTDGPLTEGGEPRLVIGTSQTHAITDAELGRLPMVDAVAGSVREAAAAAGIDPRDASYVLTKSCLPTVPVAPHQPTEAGYDDMPTLLRASGAAALGVGIAVGDVTRPGLDSQISTDAALWSGRASTSTGHENPETQVVLLGNRPGAGGTLRIGRAVMADALDVSALNRAVRDAGLDVPGDQHLPEQVRARVVAVFVKSGNPEPTLRGRRQVQEDENPHYIAQVKATIGGIFAAAVGDPALYISGAAVHQGPPGGGSVAVIVDHGPEVLR